MVELKNKEKGNKVFLVATGNSIKEQDLSLLENETVIGMSNLYKHKDFKRISPKYYILTRMRQHLKYQKDEILLYDKLKELNEEIPTSTILFLDENDRDIFNKLNIFKNHKIVFLKFKSWDYKEINEIDISNFLDFCFISEAAIQIALYLNFDSIYLLGYDHTWVGNNYSYFYKSNDKYSNKLQNLDSEFILEQYSKAFSKYKALYKMKKNIFNANHKEDSYVDTFPKIRYEDLFSKNKKTEGLEEESKKRFLEISSLYIENKDSQIKVEEEKFYNRFHNISLFLNTINKKYTYLIYGYGEIGKLIHYMTKNNSIGYIDKNYKRYKDSNIYDIEEVKQLEFDKIIISLIGRGEKISSELQEKYSIDKNKIITLEELIK